MTADDTMHRTDLRISTPLRIWLAVEVLFGTLSILTIAWTPQDTQQHFSWTIKPEVTAALLGGFYIAAASFYVLSLFALRWDNIRVFVPASILFSTVELVATIVHWDKFAVGTTPFNVWFVSYLLPPPLFAYFYWWHQKRAAPIPRADDEPLPVAMRQLMRPLGAAIVVFAVVIFFVPSVLVALAPITFTPLTTRAFSGWVLATGMLLLLAARENDRTRVRIISPFFILVLPAVGLEMTRFSGQIDFANPSLYVGGAVLFVVFLIGIAMARGDWRKTMR